MDAKKTSENLNEKDTYNKRSNSQLFSHSRVSLSRSFFGEEYKQYLTFSVEISTNTFIKKYSKHLWSYEQRHTHKGIKLLLNSEKEHKYKKYFLLNFICLSFNNTTSGH